MDRQVSVIGEEGLRFFGRISASISHELKNALSIINEGAGLLEDLAAMSAKGLPFDTQRLPPLGEKIRRQVQKADLIIKRMNRLAHSVDVPTAPVDLEAMLQQICELAERFAVMRNAGLDVAPSTEPLQVVSAPFLLQNVVWLCIDFAIQSIRPGDRLVLQAEKTGGGARVRIQAPSGLSHAAMDQFLPADRFRVLLEGLKATLAIDESRQVIAIELPHKIDSERTG